MLFAVFVSGCSNKALMTTIPFNLNVTSENFNPPQITFVQSLEVFNEFLGREDIFTSEPSERFAEINTKYDLTYFENNDLIILIFQASSSMIKGYKLENLEKGNQNWIVSVSPVSNNGHITADMGGYFCYYITVSKDTTIQDAILEF